MQHLRNNDIRYLANSAKAGLGGISVNTIGFESVPPHSDYPIGSHPHLYTFSFERGRTLHEFQLIYLTRGKGFFASVPSEIHSISEGTVLIVKPGEWHTYRPQKDIGWECYWVGSTVR